MSTLTRWARARRGSAQLQRIKIGKTARAAARTDHRRRGRRRLFRRRFALAAHRKEPRKNPGLASRRIVRRGLSRARRRFGISHQDVAGRGIVAVCARTRRRTVCRTCSRRVLRAVLRRGMFQMKLRRPSRYFHQIDLERFFFFKRTKKKKKKKS